MDKGETTDFVTLMIYSTLLILKVVEVMYYIQCEIHYSNTSVESDTL